MQRDLLDALRCSGAHEEAWLVAMVHAADGADLREADLACPVCGREFVVRDGVAYFGVAQSGLPPQSPSTTVDARAAGDDAEVSASADTDASVRLAAQLAVTGGVMPILLADDYARVGHALRMWTTAPQLWLNPPGIVAAVGDGISALRVDGAPLPIGAATLAAAAVDATHAHTTWMTSVVRSIRQGGRLVAPAHVPVPDGVRELARDSREWVGEVLAPPSGLVTLRRQSAPA